MPKNITSEADMSLLPMSECITGLSDDVYVREIVTAQQIFDATDMFTNLGPTRVNRVLIKFGFRAVGPVCEMLEEAAGGASDEAIGPGVFVETSDESVVTNYRLRSEGLADIGLKRLNFANASELAAEDSLLSSRVRRMGGQPEEVARFIFENIPTQGMPWLEQ